jgi:hypothetical protein
MIVNKLWKFPVLSGHIDDFMFFFPGHDAYLFFEYMDETTQYQSFHGNISFQDVMAFRRSADMFTHLIPNAYDTIVEIPESNWIKDLRKIHPEYATYWGLKHFAIFLKDQGQYEFAASGYKVSDITPGKLKEEDLWTLKS